jgi:hypothetical protein
MGLTLTEGHDDRGSHADTAASGGAGIGALL